MKNYLIIPALSVMLFSVVSQDANAEWKFGISVGQSDIDYEILETYVDPGSGLEAGDDADTYSNASEYNATELIFDFRNGPHAIAYKITDGTADGWDESYTVNGEAEDISGDADTYSSDANREEWTLSYAYSFGNNFTLSAGLYSGTLDYSYNGTWLSPGNEGTYYEDLWSGAETGAMEYSSEGAFLAAGYSNKISEKLFWFAKLGFQASDIEVNNSYNWSNTYTAVNDDWYQSGIEFYQANYGVVNGTYNINRDRIREAEGEATVFGLGLVYAINPKNSIILEYESKSFSLDPGEETSHVCTGLAYICDQAELSTYENVVEEDASYITLRYRYAF